jgi:hypothetical protein
VCWRLLQLPACFAAGALSLSVCCCCCLDAANLPPVPPLTACLPACLPWLLQMEAERQHKIREEVKHELRVFYCEVRLRCACAVHAVGVGWAAEAACAASPAGAPAAWARC